MPAIRKLLVSFPSSRSCRPGNVLDLGTLTTVDEMLSLGAIEEGL